MHVCVDVAAVSAIQCDSSIKIFAVCFDDFFILVLSISLLGCWLVVRLFHACSLKISMQSITTPKNGQKQQHASRNNNEKNEQSDPSSLIVFVVVVVIFSTESLFCSQYACECPFHVSACVCVWVFYFFFFFWFNVHSVHSHTTGQWKYYLVGWRRRCRCRPLSLYIYICVWYACSVRCHLRFHNAYTQTDIPTATDTESKRERVRDPHTYTRARILPHHPIYFCRRLLSKAWFINNNFMYIFFFPCIYFCLFPFSSDVVRALIRVRATRSDSMRWISYY